MRWYLLLIALGLLVFMCGSADGRHVIKAYCNGQEATVTGMTLKVGEPFTVDLYVTPDRYTTVSVRLREPGGGLESYRRISGDPEDTTRKKGGPNDTVHYRWVMAPTDAWTGGVAPLDIQYNVWGKTMDGDVQGYFTVMEAYISPEEYQTPAQAGPDPVTQIFTALATLTLAARQRLSRITKPIYSRRLLVRHHVRKIIQTIKNKKGDTSQGLDAQHEAGPVGCLQHNQLQPLTYF